MTRRPDGDDLGPRSLESSLDAVSRSLGMRSSQGLGDLFSRWEDLVGEGIAAHVRPVRLDRDVLVVAVDHPAWATQVRQLGDELLDRVADGTDMPRPHRLEIRIRR
jgi:predicted nucleic acid-binding Zn ribbon protein